MTGYVKHDSFLFTRRIASFKKPETCFYSLVGIIVISLSKVFEHYSQDTRHIAIKLLDDSTFYFKVE